MRSDLKAKGLHALVGCGNSGFLKDTDKPCDAGMTWVMSSVWWRWDFCSQLLDILSVPQGQQELFYQEVSKLKTAVLRELKTCVHSMPQS